MQLPFIVLPMLARMVDIINSCFSRLCNFLRPSCLYGSLAALYSQCPPFYSRLDISYVEISILPEANVFLRIQSTQPGQPYLQTWQLTVIDYVSILAISNVSLIQVFSGRLAAVVSMAGTGTQCQLFFAEKITLPTVMMREATGAALMGYIRVAYHA